MIYRTADFLINTETFELFFKHESVACEPKVFDLIVYLLINRNRLVSRDELFEELWQGTEVSDASLSNHIKTARKLLGDDGLSQSIIKTVRGRGYQFVADLKVEISDEQFTPKNPIPAKTIDLPPHIDGKLSNRKFLLISVITSVVLIMTIQLVLYFQKDSEISNSSYLIAVVPLTNTNPHPDTDYLGLAISDRVISELAYLENINVRSSNSTRKFNGSSWNPQQIGSELNVEYVLSGSYLSIENVVRLNIELIRVSDNHLVWRSKQIQVNNQNTFLLQDIVANEVLSGFKLNLDIDRKSKYQSTPTNSLAYDYYLKSIAQPYSTAGHQQAIALLKDSISLDSNYAPAYVQLGNRIRRLEQFGLVNTGESHDTLSYYQKALSINPNLLSALSHLAFAYTESNRIEEAMLLVLRMLEINPTNAQTRFTLGYVFRYAGLVEEALTQMQLAITLDPKNQRFRSIIATYSGMNRFDKALKQLAAYPESSFTIGWQGLLDIRLGNKTAAVENFERLITQDADSLWGLVASVHKAYLTNDFEPGLVSVHKLEQTNIADAETVYYVAVYYCMLGDQQRCLNAYKKSVDSGYYNHQFFANSPYFDKARKDARFIAIYNLSKQLSQSFTQKFLVKAKQFPQVAMQ